MEKLCHDSNGGCPLQQVIRRCIKKGASLPDAPEPATRVVFRKSDLGYPAWTGSTSGKVSDDAIISSLGIGIVSYKDVPSEELEAPDYTYRVDTDVISSIMLTSSTEVNPKNPAKATFYINGGTYTVSNIVMPSGETERSSIRGNSRTTVWTLRFCC